MHINIVCSGQDVCTCVRAFAICQSRYTYESIYHVYVATLHIYVKPCIYDS